MARRYRKVNRLQLAREAAARCEEQRLKDAYDEVARAFLPRFEEMARTYVPDSEASNAAFRALAAEYKATVDAVK